MSNTRDRDSMPTAIVCAALGIVAIALGACWTVSELSGWVAWTSLALVANAALSRARSSNIAVLHLAVMSVAYFAGRLITGPIELFTDERFSGEAHIQTFFVVVFGLLACTLPVLVWHGVRDIRDRRDDRRPLVPPTCDACGYDLRGNTTGVCPECGVRIER